MRRQRHFRLQHPKLRAGQQAEQPKQQPVATSIDVAASATAAFLRIFIIVSIHWTANISITYEEENPPGD